MTLSSRHEDKNGNLFGMDAQGDALDDMRVEASSILQMQYERGNNGFVKRKYVTLTIEAENLPAARARFSRIEADTLNRFKVMGAGARVLDGKDRLTLLHGLLHPEGGQFAFEWDWLPASGLSVKDFISPSSFEFGETRRFRMGEMYGAVSFLQILAPEIQDRILTDFMDVEGNLLVTMHVRGINQNEAIKMVKRKITDLDAMKIQEQKKAARSGYDLDTLAMMAERDAKITLFHKEKYHLLRLTLDGAEAVSEKFTDPAEAEQAAAMCKGVTVTCTSVTKEQKKEQPPKLYDLTTLQREANRLFGYTAKQTLDYAQSLYEKKLLTYPRTDSRYLTSDMVETASCVIHLAAKLPPFDSCSNFFPLVESMISDKDVSDHHAIIPTMEIERVDIKALPLGERSLFLLVCCNLLCASAEPYVYEAVTATFDCCGHSFTAKGKRNLSEGWREIDRIFRAFLKEKSADGDGGTLPDFTEGQTFDGAEVAVTEHFTQPPKPFTEDSLPATRGSKSLYHTKTALAVPHSTYCCNGSYLYDFHGIRKS